jgi:chromosome segregation ATPase
MQALDREIAIQERKLVENDAGNIARLQEEMQRLRERIVQHRESKASVRFVSSIFAIERKANDLRSFQLMHQRDHLHQETGSGQNEIRRIRADIQKATENRRSFERNIAALEKRKTDQDFAFGDRVRDIRRSIEECTRRKEWKGLPPVGPIGEEHCSLSKGGTVC